MLKPENLRSLSREIDIKLCQNYTITYICKILYKIRNIKQIIFSKYATNLKTTISQRSLRNSGVLLLLFEFNNFSFLIKIIDNIFWRLEHVTRTPTNGSAVLLSCVSIITWPVYCIAIWGSFGHVIRTYILHIYVFHTILFLFLETGTSDRCLIGLVQLLRFSAFSLYTPFNFSFTILLNCRKILIDFCVRACNLLFLAL